MTSTPSPRITAAIRAAIDAVARTHHFEPGWLNDRAAAFTPVGLHGDDCELLFDHPYLRVLGPPPEYVFVMKLFAARGGPDHNDMVALWSRCSFTSVDVAVALYHAAYPHAPSDPHLAVYVADIATEAGDRRHAPEIVPQRADAQSPDITRLHKKSDRPRAAAHEKGASDKRMTSRFAGSSTMSRDITSAGGRI